MKSRNNSYRNSFKFSAVAVAVASAMGIMPALAAEAEAENAKKTEMETIVVTVRKREESLQNIPATVQALSEAFIKDSGAQNMEDYTRFIPGVTLISYTPGSSNIIFRGVTTGVGDFVAQASSSVYLNESSITSTGKQPDVRMLDIAGVQAMAGPQGTLYGGSAQSGIMRIQTNQADVGGFEGNVEFGSRMGNMSDNSYDVKGVINIPLIDDVFAIRLAVEKATDGGFIDNVLGYTPNAHEGWPVPEMAGTLDNANVVEKNWNSVDYSTLRFSARWEPNEDWSLSFMYNKQTNETNGDNDYNPNVGDLETIYFHKNHRKDTWDLTSLTIEGDLGWAQLVSSTSFYDRSIKSEYDATVYFLGLNKYCVAYEPTGYQYSWSTPNCLGTTIGADFVALAEFPNWSNNFSQELRLSNQGDDFDWLVGGFYESGSDNYDYVGQVATRTTDGNSYAESISNQYFESVRGMSFPDARSPWYSSDRTDWKQVAIFGELTWHINERTDLTVGGRYFKRDNDKLFQISQPGVLLNIEFQPGGDSEGLASGSDSDFVPKIALSYKISDSKMIYGLYTEGYRPGGTNRGRGDQARVQFPLLFEADKLDNYEIGAKTRWLDNTLQVNMSYFNMQWSDYQLEVVDPSNATCNGENDPICGQPWQKVVVNAGKAHTSGVQTEVAWVPAEGWELGVNAQWLEAEIDEDFDPGNIKKGMLLPNVPELKGSAWLSHHWEVDFIKGGEMSFRAQFSYSDSSDNQFEPNANAGNPVLQNDAYQLTDLSLGLISYENNWDIKLYINNLFDERAQFQHGTGLGEYALSSNNASNGHHAYAHTTRVYTNRPREFGVRVTYSWGD